MFDFCTQNAVYAQSNVTVPVPISKGQNELSVICNISYTVSIPGNTRRLRIIALNPESVPNIQKIKRVEYSLKPDRFFHKNGYRYAEFTINNPSRIEKLNVTVFADLYRYDLQTAMKNKEKNQFQETGFGEFLKNEEYIQKNNRQIRDIAKKIKGSSKIEIVRNIYNYVLDNMEYLVLGEKDLGAVQALIIKRGDCTEYSDLFAALCRAKGIPARVVTGFSVQSDTETAKHNWVEVYLKEYGWVPFDPSKGDVPLPALKNKLFSTLEPTYIYFSNIRNDKVLHEYHYCSFTYFGDPVSVTDTVNFEFPKKSN